MENCEKLTKAGLDTEALLKRLMGNASLIRLFVKKFCDDKTFAALETAIAAEDAKGAEIASHTLKGMCGNMSLNELFALFSEQVTRFRAGNFSGAASMMPEITVKYQNAVTNMRAWLTEL